MAWIIDGHNLIGTLPDVDLADPDDEAELLARLRTYRSQTGESLIVFFDSGDLPSRFGSPSSAGVLVKFAAPGQTADDAIVDYLRARREPGQYAVVTNDHELQWRAKNAGASVIAASEFATRLAPRPHRVPRPEEKEPDPHDPTYADLYAEFLYGEQDRARFGKDLRADRAVWAERLYGDDVPQAEKAALWLGRYGGAAALNDLRTALTHSDAKVRAAATLGLAQLHLPAVLPDLMARLAEDKATLVREAAAQGLGFMGDATVEAALEAAAATDVKGKVRKAARAALVQVRARKAAASRPTGRKTADGG
jgi:predicted RNA-binding protein with PIN domain